MQTINKYKINTWGTMILFLWTVLFFTACSDENAGIGNETDENLIAFDCSAAALRASAATVNNMQYFRVSAIWNKGGGDYESFMNNQLVEKQNGNWVYSPVRNWPALGLVSFFAHSPATLSGLQSLEIDSARNLLSIKYAVSQNHLEQEDLMVAASLDKVGKPVKLRFEHALSTLYFQACSDNQPDTTFRINEIKLINLYGKGTLKGPYDDDVLPWKWDVDTDDLSKKEYIVYQKYPFETQSKTYKEVGDLMLLPQTPRDDFRIVVSYDVIDALGMSESKTSSYPLRPDIVFEQGTKYTIFLHLDASPNKGKKAKLSTSVLVLTDVE